MIMVPEFISYRNKMEDETKNCLKCKKIQKILSDKMQILPHGINENIFKFIPCKRCSRIHTAIKNEAKHMEYHSGGIQELKLYYFIKTHPFPKYSYIKKEIVPNIKIRCNGYDKETKERIIYTRGITYNKDTHKEIKEFYKEMFRSTSHYEFEMWHRNNDNDVILSSCYDVLKALFKMLYKNEHYEDILSDVLWDIRKSWF